jgi:hypothetical protein
MKSFTKFYVLMLTLLVTFGMFAQQNLMTSVEYQVYLQQIQQKNALAPAGDYDPAMFPPPSRQGGEDVGSALVIGSLPYADAGTTSGYNNDYEGTCGSTGAPDVVYSFAPAADMLVHISLCGSSYDTKLYVFENTANNTIACNDDACGLQSELFDISFTSGNTYYIIVDGYGSSSGAYTFNMNEIIPPAGPTSITSFPFFVDFDDCNDVPEIELTQAAMAHAVINNNGVDGTCGIMLDGNSSSGWAYSTTPSVNWNNSPLHWATGWLDIVPTGGAGVLTLTFDFRMNYSFATYYNVFAVTVNGVPIADVNGDTYHTPATATGDQWEQLEYDLSAYQTDASFELRMHNAGNYYYLYYQGGDATFIDNLEVFY